MSLTCGLCNQEFNYVDVDFHLEGKCRLPQTTKEPIEVDVRISGEQMICDRIGCTLARDHSLPNSHRCQHATVMDKPFHLPAGTVSAGLIAACRCCGSMFSRIGSGKLICEECSQVARPTYSFNGIADTIVSSEPTPVVYGWHDKRRGGSLLVATEEDFTEWLAGNRYNNGRYLLDYCVCLQYPTNCRFHTDRMITDGPHNLWPPFPK